MNISTVEVQLFNHTATTPFAPIVEEKSLSSDLCVSYGNFVPLALSDVVTYHEEGGLAVRIADLKPCRAGSVPVILKI
jgi:hypothetical protein